ncbi:MAG: polysaccharide biosynthesis/export family protein [Pyrinomonadaceae bacterium]
MRSLVFAALVLSASLGMTASAQVKSVAAANNQASYTPVTAHSSISATRARVLRPDPSSVPPTGKPVSPATFQNQPETSFNNHSKTSRLRRTEILLGTPEAAIKTPAKFSITAASTQVYRVGPGDVLDIQLSDYPGRNSTLFTVLADGVLEYPLAGNSIVVGGMTTVEIAALLRQRIKIFDNPKVNVDVRDYASHAVSIIGFVSAPGTKILRREAVPLYTVLAEALVLPEAARATITRHGVVQIMVDLNDAKLSATLVVPGDAIKVTGGPPAPAQFFFIGGEIRSPGQKPFHAGLTLTQAILASGGTKTTADLKVRVSRQGNDGKLASEEFNLRKIQTGKTPDPILQSGDRLEVTAAN